MSDVQLSNKISIQLYARWYCVLHTSFKMFALDINSSIMLHHTSVWLLNCWVWANVHISSTLISTMDSTGLHAHTRHTINQQTKTKHINNKISLFDMGFIPFRSSYNIHSKSYTTRCKQTILLIERNLVGASFCPFQPTSCEVSTIILNYCQKWYHIWLGFVATPPLTCFSMLRKYKCRERTFNGVHSPLFVWIWDLYVYQIRIVCRGYYCILDIVHWNALNYEVYWWYFVLFP